MARKKALKIAGSLVVLDHTSKVLAGNPLGDPVTRKVAVWLPMRAVNYMLTPCAMFEECLARTHPVAGCY